jgi:hypothetical protein
MSAFLGPDQSATEERLIADPDCHPWVDKYQRSRDTVSRTDYEVTVHPFARSVNAEYASAFLMRTRASACDRLI